jgi:3-phenylpropionate/trans-cinnamate dioxygenase ferredoxin reductase component
MLGGDVAYDRLPYFFSDQYDVGMEYIGLHSPTDTVEVRGSLDDEDFRVLWHDGDGRVTAGMHVNQWDTIEEIEGLIRAEVR